MPRSPILATLAFSALAVAAPRASAAPGAHDPEELRAILQVAQRELADHIDRCTGGDVRMIRDEASERTFVSIAGMFHFFIQHYPYPEIAAVQRTEHVRDASLALERAFSCSPHWDKRHYLEDALALIKQRQREIADEKRSDTKRETDALAEDAQRITRRLDALPRPTERRPSDEATPPPPPREPTGYARWRDRLSLRLELGGGSVHVREYLSDGSRVDAEASAFTFALAPGVRFLAGANRRHVFVVGFLYEFLGYSVDHRDKYQMAHIMAARGEYALRLHPRWLSLHAAFEGGIEAHLQNNAFGRELFGFSFALCTANEALCARTRSLWTAAKARDFIDAPIVGLLSVDAFRVADHLLPHKDPPR